MGAWREYSSQQKIKKGEQAKAVNETTALVDLMRKAKERRFRAEQKKAQEQVMKAQQAAARKVLHYSKRNKK